jgi:hypothetical protein
MQHNIDAMDSTEARPGLVFRLGSELQQLIRKPSEDETSMA